MSARLLQGRYLLRHEIGAGGMGVVHLGVLIDEAGFRRRVAIKRLRDRHANDPQLRARFVDEARLAGDVDHANVVRTLDVVSEAGELFLIMDYVAGETLAGLLRAAAGPVPAPVAVALLVDALRGLHAIHEARGRDGRALGLVHHDVSPQNLMAGLDGAGYVLDFGIARATSDGDQARDTTVGGKLAYMSPETMLSGEVTRRSDLYSAGLVLWEALTGRRFRTGSSVGELVRHVYQHDVTTFSALAARLPEELKAVVCKACARTPVNRYATASDMAAALEAACPAASRTAVTAWVLRLAGEAIERRGTPNTNGAESACPRSTLDQRTAPVHNLARRRGHLMPGDPVEETRPHTRRATSATPASAPRPSSHKHAFAPPPPPPATEPPPAPPSASTRPKTSVVASEAGFKRTTLPPETSAGVHALTAADGRRPLLTTRTLIAGRPPGLEAKGVLPAPSAPPYAPDGFGAAALPLNLHSLLAPRAGPGGHDAGPGHFPSLRAPLRVRAGLVGPYGYLVTVTALAAANVASQLIADLSEGSAAHGVGDQAVATLVEDAPSGARGVGAVVGAAPTALPATAAFVTCPAGRAPPIVIDEEGDRHVNRRCAPRED